MLMETDKSYIRELIIKHTYADPIEEQKAAIRRAIDERLGSTSKPAPSRPKSTTNRSMAAVTEWRVKHGWPVPQMKNIAGRGMVVVMVK